jgi:hypothetical protein
MPLLINIRMSGLLCKLIIGWAVYDQKYLFLNFDKCTIRQFTKTTNYLFRNPGFRCLRSGDEFGDRYRDASFTL